MGQWINGSMGDGTMVSGSMGGWNVGLGFVLPVLIHGNGC